MPGRSTPIVLAGLRATADIAEIVGIIADLEKRLVDGGISFFSGTLIKFYCYAGRMTGTSAASRVWVPAGEGSARQSLAPATPLIRVGSRMRAEIWKAVRNLYAAGILVYFGAAGILAVSMPDFSEWVSFMGRHAVYAVAWPAAAVAEINSWREPSGRLGSLR